jgi:hypothetical protein
MKTGKAQFSRTCFLFHPSLTFIPFFLHFLLIPVSTMSSFKSTLMREKQHEQTKTMETFPSCSLGFKCYGKHSGWWLMKWDLEMSWNPLHCPILCLLVFQAPFKFCRNSQNIFHATVLYYSIGNKAHLHTWPVTFPDTYQWRLTKAMTWILSEDVLAFHGSQKTFTIMEDCLVGCALEQGWEIGLSAAIMRLCALRKEHVICSSVL